VGAQEFAKNMEGLCPGKRERESQTKREGERENDNITVKSRAREGLWAGRHIRAQPHLGVETEERVQSTTILKLTSSLCSTNLSTFARKTTRSIQTAWPNRPGGNPGAKR